MTPHTPSEYDLLTANSLAINSCGQKSPARVASCSSSRLQRSLAQNPLTFDTISNQRQRNRHRRSRSGNMTTTIRSLQKSQSAPPGISPFVTPSDPSRTAYPLPLDRRASTARSRRIKQKSAPILIEQSVNSKVDERTLEKSEEDTRDDFSATKAAATVGIVVDITAIPGSSATKANKRSVHFGTVQVREYQVILGDHPTCVGPPLTLSWEYWPSHTGRDERTVDNYEKRRGLRLRGNQLKLSSMARENLLRKMGVSEEDIVASWRRNEGDNDVSSAGQRSTKNMMVGLTTLFRKGSNGEHGGSGGLLMRRVASEPDLESYLSGASGLRTIGNRRGILRHSSSTS